MGSIFENFWRLGPAAFVFKAIMAAIVADGLLLAFIFLRRTYRKRYFTRRDARVFELRQQWDALISGKFRMKSGARKHLTGELWSPLLWTNSRRLDPSTPLGS